MNNKESNKQYKTHPIVYFMVTCTVLMLILIATLIIVTVRKDKTSVNEKNVSTQEIQYKKDINEEQYNKEKYNKEQSYDPANYISMQEALNIAQRFDIHQIIEQWKELLES